MLAGAMPLIHDFSADVPGLVRAAPARPAPARR